MGTLQPSLSDVNGEKEAKFALAMFGEIKTLRIYNCHLRTSEAVGNWRAGA
jgi:hypothetical protein